MPKFPMYFEKKLSKYTSAKGDAKQKEVKERGFLGMITMSNDAVAALGLTGLFENPATAPTPTIIEIAPGKVKAKIKQTDANGNVTFVTQEVDRVGHFRTAPVRQDKIRGKTVIIELNEKVDPTDPKSSWKTVVIGFPPDANIHHIADWLGQYIPDEKKDAKTTSDLRGTFTVRGGGTRRIMSQAEAQAFTADNKQGSESPADLAAYKALIEKAKSKPKSGSAA